MAQKNRAVLIALPLLLLAGIAALVSNPHQEGFTGSRVKNPDAYLLDIERMNGTDLHTLELHEGDVLAIRFDTEKGELYAEIKAPDGTTVYRGNGKEASFFTVNIRESGVYTIAVEARRTELGSSLTAVGFYRKLGYTFKSGVTDADEYGVVRLEKRKEG